MKVVICISLFATLCFPFLGAWQFFSYQIQQVKEHSGRIIAEGIDEDQKVIFKFTDEEISNLRWEHSREFEFEGEMYDVISSEKKGEVTWFWCYKDVIETSVKNEIKTLIAKALGQCPQQQNSNNQIQHFLRTLYSNTYIALGIDHVFSKNCTRVPNYFFSSLTFISLPVIPPPK